MVKWLKSLFNKIAIKRLSQKIDLCLSKHRFILVFLIALVAVICAWLFTPNIVTFFDPKNRNRGIVGDMFGVINSLFSGLALVFLIVACYLQYLELKDTKKAYEDQIKHTNRSHDYEVYHTCVKNEPILVLLDEESFNNIENLSPSKMIMKEVMMNSPKESKDNSNFFRGNYNKMLYLRNFGESAYNFEMKIYHEEKGFEIEDRRYYTPFFYKEAVFQVCLVGHSNEFIAKINYTNQIGYRLYRKFIIHINTTDFFGKSRMTLLII